MDTFLLGFYDELEKIALSYEQRNPRTAAHMNQYGKKYTLNHSQVKNLESKVNNIIARNHQRGVEYGTRRGVMRGIGGTLGAAALGYGGYKLYKHLKGDDKDKKKARA